MNIKVLQVLVNNGTPEFKQCSYVKFIFQTVADNQGQVQKRLFILNVDKNAN